MAKRRKTAAKTAAKPATKAVAQSQPAKPSAPNPDVTVQALAILVVIVIVLAGGYLYNQNAKPAGAPLDITPAAHSTDKK